MLYLGGCSLRCLLTRFMYIGSYFFCLLRKRGWRIALCIPHEILSRRGLFVSFPLPEWSHSRSENDLETHLYESWMLHQRLQESTRRNGSHDKRNGIVKVHAGRMCRGILSTFGTSLVLCQDLLVTWPALGMAFGDVAEDIDGDYAVRLLFASLFQGPFCQPCQPLLYGKH